MASVTARAPEEVTPVLAAIGGRHRSLWVASGGKVSPQDSRYRSESSQMAGSEEHRGAGGRHASASPH